MKIAFFSTNFSFIGGAEVCILNVARQLDHRGHEITFYLPFSAARKLRADFPGEVRSIVPRSDPMIRRFPDMAKRVIGKQLRAAQRDEAYDVWHVHWAYASAYIATALTTEVPRVVTCQGADIQTLPEIGYGMRLDPEVARRSDEGFAEAHVVTAISGSIRDDMIAAGVAADKIHDVPNGTDCSLFAQDIDRARIRAQLDVPEDCLLIITTGRNHPKKGYRHIPEAASRLRDVHEHFRWLVIGHATNALDDELATRGLSQHVRTIEQITPFDADAADEGAFQIPSRALVELYLAADIYAFPTLMEGLPLILPEAMAAGLCVVTTDAAGCRDVIAHDVNGMIAPVGDTSGFADNLIRVVGDKAVRERLSAQARCDAERYDWPVITDGYLRAYEAAIERAASPVGEQA